MKMVKQGFTLIELLIVIAIIGVLSSVIIPSLNSARGRASDSSKITGTHQVAKAMEVSRNQSTGLVTGYANTAAATIGLQTYLEAWPTGVVFIDNTGDTESYCVYAVLADSDFDYFVASESNSGYKTTLPTLGSCDSDA